MKINVVKSGQVSKSVISPAQAEASVKMDPSISHILIETQLKFSPISVYFHSLVVIKVEKESVFWLEPQAILVTIFAN